MWGRIKRAIIEMPCQGETHRIEIDDELKARALDHDKGQLKTLLSFRAFNADIELPPCVKWLRLYQTDPWWTVMQLAPPPSEATYVACTDCDWEGNVDQVRPYEIDAFFDRVEPGEIMPAGECPKCGFLVYLGKEPNK